MNEGIDGVSWGRLRANRPAVVVEVPQLYRNRVRLLWFTHPLLAIFSTPVFSPSIFAMLNRLSGRSS